MKPAKKSQAMENFLEQISGRTTAINQDVCIPAPIGCGKPVEGFRDGQSLREYTISGLCQECQDKVFGTEEE